MRAQEHYNMKEQSRSLLDPLNGIRHKMIYLPRGFWHTHTISCFLRLELGHCPGCQQCHGMSETSSVSPGTPGRNPSLLMRDGFANCTHPFVCFYLHLLSQVSSLLLIQFNNSDCNFENYFKHLILKCFCGR